MRKASKNWWEDGQRIDNGTFRVGNDAGSDRARSAARKALGLKGRAAATSYAIRLLDVGISATGAEYGVYGVSMAGEGEVVMGLADVRKFVPMARAAGLARTATLPDSRWIRHRPKRANPFGW